MLYSLSLSVAVTMFATTLEWKLGFKYLLTSSADNGCSVYNYLLKAEIVSDILAVTILSESVRNFILI